MNRITSTLKVTLGALMLLLMFTTSVVAQESKIDEGAAAVTTQMKAKLSLNDSQYTKVLHVNKTFLKSATAAKEKGGTRVEMAKKMRALNDRRDTKLKSVLNATQYKIYKANRSSNYKKLRAYYENK
ncbi:MAG: hypothetical protein BM557_11360 [Flavobacterium sp. MedPE-SWcel]|uniref:hypothetical protein n=1 Tax=uncultured Flavobacterium sp. TaxID=165435 RepID=UPI000920E4D0|nr:hypothetical protein [uncultured Flavobacterium sp.]OIQ15434.1 MAG: hypothetical protein BM557_11360 [Flavobacterium sp. MedPE-SWcel]